MSDTTVLLSINDHVAHVQFNRAEKMNALNAEMFSELIEIAKQIQNNSSIRSVVISGQGGNFCSGLDKSNFSSVMQGQGLQLGKDKQATILSKRTHGIYNLVQAVALQWRDIYVPVIAAIEGVALGGGLQIALAADMRYAAPAAQFSILEIKWGLVPDMGSTQLMRHLVSEDIVRELSFTGRMFSAVEAQNYGFITSIADDPIEHAMAMAEQISNQNPDAIRAIKSLFNAAPYLTLEEGMQMESQLQDELVGTTNQLEAVLSVIEKRKANFKD